MKRIEVIYKIVAIFQTLPKWAKIGIIGGLAILLVITPAEHFGGFIESLINVIMGIASGVDDE